MSFIHIPKTQLQQMFRTGRTDQSGEAIAGLYTVGSYGGHVAYISNNGGIGWMSHASFIAQITSPLGYSGLRLYKGAMPTISEINAFQYIDSTPFGSNGDWWASYIRPADALVKLDINASGSGVMNSSGELVVNFNAGTASQTGTASWFCFRTMPASDQTSFGVNQAYTIFGTVGLTGSGADLELLTTSIVSGGIARISTLKIPFPSALTW